MAQDSPPPAIPSPPPKPRKFTAGVPEESAIAFIAAFGVLFVIILLLGVILKFSNPPRLEARHASLPPVGVRPKDPRQQQQTARVNSQGGNASTSQANLLTPAPAQGYSHPVYAGAAPPSSKRYSSQQGMYLQAPQSSSGATLLDSKPPRSKALKSRALPVPPIESYSDQYRYNTGYADPYASNSPEQSPFESQQDLALTTTRRPSRLSRGYVPLPEPPVNANVYSDRDDRLSYYGGTLSYYNQSQPGSQSTQHRRTKSGSSQLSRVESIGAGDRRRHSKRGRNNSTRKMTTAERVRALREANMDAQESSPSKRYAAGAASEPYTDSGYQQSYAYDSNYSKGDYGYASYDNESEYYPVKEEYCYAYAPSAWDEQSNSQANYDRGYQQPLYQHRYNPF
ncbi:hypothetical protein MNAN1_001708 [Malassezia nana]|uniref:Uncharacterized protein n=1 Tax=Malassezia nana TaxID=180528 RepID=A0AAF0J3E6_9BASI|nr:hypothetical protein MNAN1_001708 [Malassezia nana]